MILSLDRRWAGLAGRHAGENMTVQIWLWGAAGAALALAAIAGVAESRRHRRRSLDRPGWVPWRGLQVTAFFAVITLAILAWKAG
jgi:hypothetical protein